MAADRPITVYPKTDTMKGGKTGKRDITFSKPSRKSLQNAVDYYEDWKKRGLKFSFDPSKFK